MNAGGEHGDSEDRGERPRRSWREIDQQRDRPGSQSEPKPRSPIAEERARTATRSYLKKIDALFAGGPGAEAERLVERVRSTQGTPDFTEACLAYTERCGPPRDPVVASLFLDGDDRAVLLAGLEGLGETARCGELSLTPGLRTRLRMLAENADDDIAYAAEELLEND